MYFPGFLTPLPPRGPGPGPGGPWAMRLPNLWGNSEVLGSNLNALYEELASCRGVSETATTP